MANFIECGDDIFSAYVSGKERSSNRSFLARQMDRVSTVVSERGRQFMQRARDAFDAYDTDLVDRGLNAIKRRLDARWGNTDIKSLTTIGELQNANLKMQRWLSANPRARKMVHNERACGWGDSYVNLEPGLWGEQHSDWRCVMNGMAQTDDEGNTTFTTYFDVFDDQGNEELTFSEQVDVLRSWDALEDLFDLATDDPTDPNNNAL